MPDTTGTVPNLAAFRGQTLPLRQADQRVYSKIHFFGTTADGNGGGDFLLRFSDGSQQIVPVAFADWCAPTNTPAHHVAIGPLSQRYRPTPQNSDGARCAIYHVPADVTPGKTLISVTLPRGTTSGTGGNRQAYLMALTLEEPNGGFRSPDLSGQVAVRRRPDVARVRARGQPGGAGRRRRLVHGAGRGHAERRGRDRRLGPAADPVPPQRRRRAGLRRHADRDRRRRRRSRSSTARSTRPATPRASRRCRSRSTARRPRHDRRRRAERSAAAPACGTTGRRP